MTLRRKSRVPVGCKCADDWNATRRVPDICGRFQSIYQDCDTCMHARACHSASRAKPIDLKRDGEDSLGRSLDGGVRVAGRS